MEAWTTLIPKWDPPFSIQHLDELAIRASVDREIAQSLSILDLVMSLDELSVFIRFLGVDCFYVLGQRRPASALRQHFHHVTINHVVDARRRWSQRVTSPDFAIHERIETERELRSSECSIRSEISQLENKLRDRGPDSARELIRDFRELGRAALVNSEAESHRSLKSVDEGFSDRYFGSSEFIRLERAYESGMFPKDWDEWNPDPDDER